jgi:4a-hydroxytetrahydrobiopterin dehydratase
MVKVQGKSQKTLRSRPFKQEKRIVYSRRCGVSYQLIPKALSSKELEVALDKLKGWQLQGGKLHRQFCFSSFEKALGFMSGLALSAKTIEHTLEESNLYNCVTVDLITPETGGITDLDVHLAQKANELACLLKAF